MTPKPYLINVIRMPALQMLLLFAKSIDTNNNFSRIVFDSWIEARFPKPLEALKTLYQATKIRSMWQKFLTAKLLEQDNVDSERMQDQLGTIHILRKHLYSTKNNLTKYLTFLKDWFFLSKQKSLLIKITF